MPEPVQGQFADPTTATIATFLLGIGLDLRAGTVAGPRPLPGIDIDRGVLIVDESHLLHPGDLLHEAGHLAVVPPDRRAAFHRNVGDDPAEEMMAIAWSYAAALHLEIDLAVLFHQDGYRGGSEAILAAFQPGPGFGTPMLDYVGMAHAGTRPFPPGAKPFPAMIRWLRP